MQLHPFGTARLPADGAPQAGDDRHPAGEDVAHNVANEGNSRRGDHTAKPQSDPPAGSEAPQANVSREPQRLPARKVVVTVKTRRRRGNAPAQVLARSLDGFHALPSRALNDLFDSASAEIREARTRASADEKSDGTAAVSPIWEIWLANLRYLRSHSLRFSSGNVADAEDALSEAMLNAARTFDGATIHNHRAWLLRLVHNACMDRHRRNSRQNRLAKDLTDTDARAAPAAAIQPDRSPEELLAALEQIGDLQRAMNALPPFLAEPLLRYLDDESDAEIAGSLNVTKEVIRKRRQIARAMLRRHIED